MNRLYRAWCRSCTRASCSPLAIGLALIVVVIGVSGAVSWVRDHADRIMQDMYAAGAASLTVLACLLLAWAARTVAAATGQHTEILPLPQAEPVPVPVPAEAAEPGSYTWRIRPAEAAEMEAAADVLADEDSGVVVSERGDIYELAVPEDAS